jgi:hypothetical protein
MKSSHPKDTKKSPVRRRKSNAIRKDDTTATPMTMISTTSTKAVILKLSRNDVILGRGNGVATWCGNISFRQMIWEHRKEYRQSGRFEKAKIAKRIIQAIATLKPPGQFVEIVDSTTLAYENTYQLVSFHRAFEKTCQGTSTQPCITSIITVVRHNMMCTLLTIPPFLLILLL